MKNLVLSINKFGNFENAYKNENVKDVIDVFRMAFNQLHGDKEILQNKITIYENSVRNYVFKNHLEEIEELDNLIHTFHELKIEIEDKFFEVVIIRVSSDYKPDRYTREEALNRLNIIDVLDGYISSISTGLFMDIDKNKYLAFITSESNEGLKRIEHDTIEAVKNGFGFELSIGISSSFCDLKELIKAFHQGLKANKYAHFFSLHNRSIYHQDIASMSIDTIPYPINAEIGILKNIIFKNRSQAISCIKELSDTIENMKDLDYAMVVFNRLLSTLDKEFSFSCMEESEPFKELGKLDQLKDISAYFIAIIDRMVDHMMETEQNENDYCTQVKQYINENAAHIDNVTDISNYINVSYPYLSKLFKEQTGINVLDYLNTVRIEKSKNMLRSTNDNLQTISEAVGYNNIQSFQRFFKKFEALTPGEYRKMHQHVNR